MIKDDGAAGSQAVSFVVRVTKERKVVEIIQLKGRLCGMAEEGG